MEKNTIRYPFTKDGVKWFMRDAYSDVFEVLENCNPMTDNYSDISIHIRIRDREIIVPDVAMCYELLNDYLADAYHEAMEA